MAGAGSGLPNKRGGPVSLNLVPFVDLFSTIIIFLIATAVLDQLAAIDVNLSASGPGDANIKVPEKKIASDVKITVNKNAILLFENGKTTSVAIPEGENAVVDYTAVQSFVRSIRERYPEKKDMLVLSADDSKYENLIAVLDRCLEFDFADVVVSGQGGA